MKRCLVDVNVLLALLVSHHELHGAARDWFRGLAGGEACLCRMVQLALIRLLGNPSVMGGHALSAATSWSLLQTLLEDERLDFAPEPTLDSVFPALLRYRVPTSKLVGDSYLAAFSIAGSLQLVTFDSGFRQFKGLDLKLLNGLI